MLYHLDRLSLHLNPRLPSGLDLSSDFGFDLGAETSSRSINRLIGEEGKVYLITVELEQTAEDNNKTVRSRITGRWTDETALSVGAVTCRMSHRPSWSHPGTSLLSLAAPQPPLPFVLPPAFQFPKRIQTDRQPVRVNFLKPIGLYNDLLNRYGFAVCLQDRTPIDRRSESSSSYLPQHWP